jgi:hypothetical protein
MRARDFITEATQLNPDIVREIEPASILSSIEDAWYSVYPDVRLYSKIFDPEVSVGTSRARVGKASQFGQGDLTNYYLTVSAGIESGTINIQILDAQAGQFKGVTTRILAQIFQDIEDFYGQGQRNIIVQHDASGGRWAQIAQQLGAEFN